jgi:hypothetical protein
MGVSYESYCQPANENLLADDPRQVSSGFASNFEKKNPAEAGFAALGKLRAYQR